MSGSRYTELQVTTHFSFLRGASSCEELFATAAVMGVEALAVVDRNSHAGVVRAHEVELDVFRVAEFGVLVFPGAVAGFPSNEPVFASMFERRLPIDVVPGTVM